MRRLSLIAAALAASAAPVEPDYASLKFRVMASNVCKPNKKQKAKKVLIRPGVRRNHQLKVLDDLLRKAAISKVERAQAEHMPLKELFAYVDRLWARETVRRRHERTL